ncbi:MAG: 8-amino-7-oxononanoate synthase [Deltaproteobacteria bacterium]|nr:8-amino-7-oxononanoate synthase [Deltaproteobacteria bacterium]MDQ3295022.1 8-amino-7-oxononanoate synthase [Myxococcota bacterium]
MTLEDEARRELRELEAVHRLRVPRVLDGAQGARVTIDGVAVINFASNDYLGLANDPRIRSAMASSLDEDGAGAGASRLIVGNHRRHVALEAAVGDWLQRDGVRLFNSGYAANVGVLSSIARAGDVVFSDELNHASIIDGCRLSRAEIVVYPHRDLAALEHALASHRGARRIVVSESLFSMDGDLADVAALATLCRQHDAAFVLDEAHALGVVGVEGRGVAATAGVVPDVVVGTFGKALGTFGAFVASSRGVADLLWNRARSLVFSTGMPPSLAAGTTAAIECVRGSDGDARRRTVIGHARRLRAYVPALGGDVDSPIAPLLVGDDRRVMMLMAELLEAGVFVQGIRPPTVPVGTARLRISVSAANDAQQLETLATSLGNAMRQND